MDYAWARMDPAHRRLGGIDMVGRAQPGHAAGSASLLALAKCR
jgi:hypothetical protein